MSGEYIIVAYNKKKYKVERTWRYVKLHNIKKLGKFIAPHFDKEKEFDTWDEAYKYAEYRVNKWSSFDDATFFPIDNDGWWLNNTAVFGVDNGMRFGNQYDVIRVEHRNSGMTWQMHPSAIRSHCEKQEQEFKDWWWESVVIEEKVLVLDENRIGYTRIPFVFYK